MFSSFVRHAIQQSRSKSVTSTQLPRFTIASNYLSTTSNAETETENRTWDGVKYRKNPIVTKITSDLYRSSINEGLRTVNFLIARSDHEVRIAGGAVRWVTTFHSYWHLMHSTITINHWIVTETFCWIKHRGTSIWPQQRHIHKFTRYSVVRLPRMFAYWIRIWRYMAQCHSKSVANVSSCLHWKRIIRQTTNSTIRGCWMQRNAI